MVEKLQGRLFHLLSGLRPLIREERAQGTTEYAILVGVLVVIAIIAIIAFRDKISELWDTISSGINSL
ncbi:Flp family type IVb pilin [Collinsella vaginalis]|uniref:Flp family type IVb pilin n=1 Tax=Collinsella vaginalis TaxID=1870987 RepID=UPI000A269011|nr:class III signal peptide-containing protein [Collinsella vaginalis]